jgi:hypothetical protein
MTDTPNMNTARVGASAIVLNTGPNAGKVLIVGGADDTSTELYDPVTNTFAPPDQTPTLKVAGGGALTMLDDGKIFVTDPGSTTELFDPVANVFTAGPNSPLSGASTATLLK